MKKVELKAFDKKLYQLCDGSACTMLGYMPEELHLYINQLKENNFLKDEFTVYTCQGKDLNKTFNLSGTDEFQDNLDIFIIDLDDMYNLDKFAITLRFQMGYRWLDDIIQNARHEWEEE